MRWIVVAVVSVVGALLVPMASADDWAWRERLEAQVGRVESRVAEIDHAKGPGGTLEARVVALDARIARLEREVGHEPKHATGKLDLTSLTTDVAAFGTRIQAVIDARREPKPAPRPPAVPSPSPAEPPTGEPPPDTAGEPTPKASTPSAPAPVEPPREREPARAAREAPVSFAPSPSRPAEPASGGVGVGVGILAWVLWAVVQGWIGHAIGKSRGRGAEGMWLGLILGPIGWLLAMFLPAPFDRPRYRPGPRRRR